MRHWRHCRTHKTRKAEGIKQEAEGRRRAEAPGGRRRGEIYAGTGNIKQGKGNVCGRTAHGTGENGKNGKNRKNGSKGRKQNRRKETGHGNTRDTRDTRDTRGPGAARNPAGCRKKRRKERSPGRTEPEKDIPPRAAPFPRTVPPPRAVSPRRAVPGGERFFGSSACIFLPRPERAGRPGVFPSPVPLRRAVPPENCFPEVPHKFSLLPNPERTRHPEVPPVFPSPAEVFHCGGFRARGVSARSRNLFPPAAFPCAVPSC